MRIAFKGLVTIIIFLSFNNFSYSGEHNYFPLAVGNTWVYKTNFGEEMTLRVVGREVFSGEDCLVIEAYIGDKFIYRERRVRKEGKDFGLSVMCVEADKIFVFNPPRVMLEDSLKKGLAWSGRSKADWQRGEEKGNLQYSIEAKVVKREVLNVPAGRFTCYKIEIIETNDDYKFTSFWWYAQNIGLIKKVYPAIGGNAERVFELKSFKVKNF